MASHEFPITKASLALGVSSQLGIFQFVVSLIGLLIILKEPRLQLCVKPRKTMDVVSLRLITYTQPPFTMLLFTHTPTRLHLQLLLLSAAKL